MGQNMVYSRMAEAAFVFVVAFVLINGAVASAQNAPVPPMPEDISPAAKGPADGELNLDMKLDDLAKQSVVVPGLSTEVSTVERQKSTIGRTPNAVFVITNEMIKRSGARNIPDVLRMAPGVDVARVDGHTWSISIRGFNTVFANKLLVQIDGRVIYNGTYGGVYWNQQNVVLEDVERIEVIRGPGTTMWGSNAVNGVINIITKKTSDTTGVLVQSGGGDYDRDFNTVRYGGRAGENLTWRVYGQEYRRDRGWSSTNINDASSADQGGFRMDYTPTKDDTLTFQGDLINGSGGSQIHVPSLLPPFGLDVEKDQSYPNGNLLLRYGHVIDEKTSWQIQSYYDHYKQWTPNILTDERDTWDIDVQYQFSPADRHRFITGANYRRSSDHFMNSFGVAFLPDEVLTEWSGFFIQDTIELEEDRWYFTMGTRLENNTFGNFQAEPSLRLLFLPSERQSLWGSVSRAVRNPMRSDVGVDFKSHIGAPNVPLFLNILGNPTFKPENVLAYEIGYRAAPTDNLTWDIATYINSYNNLQGVGPPGAPVFVPPGYVFVPASLENTTQALSYGGETTVSYKCTDRWRLFASYSVFEVDTRGTDPNSGALIEGSSPHNQIYLKSSWDLKRNVNFDLMGRYVDRLTALGVPSYFEADARIAWQASENMELSFVGQNLLDDHHLEFIDNVAGFTSTEVRRTWYAMLTWKY
jgi:iron complex outermembrane recepter protein